MAVSCDAITCTMGHKISWPTSIDKYKEDSRTSCKDNIVVKGLYGKKDCSQQLESSDQCYSCVLRENPAARSFASIDIHFFKLLIDYKL